MAKENKNFGKKIGRKNINSEVSPDLLTLV